MRLRAREGAPAVRCPLCRVELANEVDPVSTCEGCQVGYHVDCLRELGGCATQGCARKGTVDGVPRPAPPVADLEKRRQILAQEHAERLERERAGLGTIRAVRTGPVELFNEHLRSITIVIGVAAALVGWLTHTEGTPRPTISAAGWIIAVVAMFLFRFLDWKEDR